MEAKSTFNEGNYNPNGFRIVAAPRRESREIINFSADYIDGTLEPTGVVLDKLFRIAQQRLQLSLKMAKRLRSVFPDSRAAVLPNTLYEGKVSVEVELYEMPVDKAQPRIFAQLAKVLAETLQEIDFSSATVKILFLPADNISPRQDGLRERYFEHKSPGWKRIRSNLYGVEIRDFEPGNPPDAAALREALRVDSIATPVQSARHASERWLEKYLKQQTGRKPHVVLNRRRVEMAGAYNHLQFEFANCEEERQPKHCPPEKMQLYYVIHNIDSGESWLAENRAETQ